MSASATHWPRRTRGVGAHALQEFAVAVDDQWCRTAGSRGAPRSKLGQRRTAGRPASSSASQRDRATAKQAAIGARRCLPCALACAQAMPSRCASVRLGRAALDRHVALQLAQVLVHQLHRAGGVAARDAVDDALVLVVLARRRCPAARTAPRSASSATPSRPGSAPGSGLRASAASRRWKELASRAQAGWSKRCMASCSCFSCAAQLAPGRRRVAFCVARLTMIASSPRRASKICRVSSGEGMAMMAPRLGRSCTMWSCARRCSTLRTTERLTPNSSHSERLGQLGAGRQALVHHALEHRLVDARFQLVARRPPRTARRSGAAACRRRGGGRQRSDRAMAGARCSLAVGALACHSARSMCAQMAPGVVNQTSPRSRSRGQVRQRPAQVPQPVGLADDVGMQRQAHHQRLAARLLAASRRSCRSSSAAKSFASIWRAMIIGMSFSSCG